ncbi:hypothetical protein SRABI126_02897 [Pedobacter sp. Bi126]|nr:hypothetical protein SRABI126_02897 [Pedobacter sp. Bi126]
MLRSKAQNDFFIPVKNVLYLIGNGWFCAFGIFSPAFWYEFR